MAFFYCVSCQQQHSSILQRDAVVIVTAFQEGDAQVVSSDGIYSRCLLDILGRESHRKVRPSERKANEERAMSAMLSGS